MSHLVKCTKCGKTFDRDKEPFITTGSRRYAHENCEMQLQLASDKKELENYIKKLFNCKEIPLKIKQQIQKFNVEQHMTYSGMLGTLQYFFEIRHNSIEKAHNSIGIIPWVYTEAKDYWTEIQSIRKKNEQADPVNISVREITIIPPERKPMKVYRSPFGFLEEEVNE